MIIQMPAAGLAGCGKMGPIAHGQDGQLLVKIVHQLPIAVEQAVEHGLGEALHPGVEHQLGILAADIHRVELDTTRLADVIQHALFAP